MLAFVGGRKKCGPFSVGHWLGGRHDAGVLAGGRRRYTYWRRKSARIFIRQYIGTNGFNRSVEHRGMRILVPFDLQPESERAVRTALELFGGQDDVHIVAVHISGGEETPEQIAANEIESLGENREASVEAEIHTIGEEPESKEAIRDELVATAAAADIDLVVLGYESKSLFDELFHRDTTERLLESHGIPVLNVP
jgi:nucleotide-binding universal stress UspA family protein